jgi:hypothetical protein
MERTRHSKLRLYGFEIIDSKIFDSEIRGLEKERSETRLPRRIVRFSVDLVRGTWQHPTHV